MSAEALLGVEGLALRVGERSLVQGLDFAVCAGEFWCVLGQNGAGKTTLLHALAGLAAPSAGRIELAGRPLESWTPREAALRRGFLPQHSAYGFSMRALDVALLGRYPHLGRRRWEDEQDLRLARGALARVDLAEVAERDVATLSGGERQRTAIAALLAQDPPLYLLDEPLAHLDLRHQLQIMALLGELARAARRGVMLSLHDPSLAARFATHALLLFGNGRSLCGRAEEVLNEGALSEAYGHRVRRLAAGGATAFVPE
jgi:iron complex transport system ATP-binding protein